MKHLKRITISLILIMVAYLIATVPSYASHGRGTARFLVGVSTFNTTVTTAGTPVQLPNLAIPDGIDFQVKAKSSNTGLIIISGSATGTAIGNGWILFPREYLSFGVPNTNMIWINATVDGDGVEVIFEQ